MPYDTQIISTIEASQPAQMLEVPDAGTAHFLSLSTNDQFVLDGIPIAPSHLTPLEQKLLEYLYERAGRVCSYDDIITAIWGYAQYDKIQNNTLAKLVSNLRRKLNQISEGAGNRHIRTILGRGVLCMPV